MAMQKDLIRLAIAEDQQLVREGVISTLTEFNFIIEAENGKQMLRQLQKAAELPDICIVDSSMPVMDGHRLIREIRKLYPEIRTLVLSAYQTELNVVRMIQVGANGYVIKNATFGELKKAIYSIHETGYYYSEIASEKLFRLISKGIIKSVDFIDRERELINYFCKDMPQETIAKEMGITIRALDGLRDRLFAKLGINSRVSLVLLAMNSGLITDNYSTPDSRLT